MAARGVISLIVLPFTIVLIIRACWMAVDAGYGQIIMSEPDQRVQLFMQQVIAGDEVAAREYLGPKVAGTDLSRLRWGILERYGVPVTTAVLLRRESPYRAILWSYTDTVPGHRYLIKWELDYENGRWMINNLQGLHELAPDLRS